ncbi:unnamed protein product, partial [Urochloa humidicola]
FPSLPPPLPILSRRTAAPSARSWGRSRQRPTRDQGAPRRSSSTRGRQSGGGARGLHLPRLLATSGGRFGRQRPGSGRLVAEAGDAGPLLTVVLLHGLPRSSALPLRGEISRPAGARPVVSAVDLAWAGRSSRGGGGPPHRRQLLPSAASMVSLYAHHPLLLRWRCGGERAQKRRSTSGVDLAVAELRTSGGHLRRPPPHILTVGGAIPPPLLPPASPRLRHDRSRGVEVYFNTA